MSHDIFISFASKDRKVATSICAALEHRGFSCWISTRNVLPGQNYQESISRAIRAAKVMLLIFTAHSNNSDEIKKEVSLASRSKLVVIPVRVEDVLPNDAFDYEFATRQWIDLFDDWESSFKVLTDQIATIVPPSPPVPEPVAPQPAPVVVDPPPAAPPPPSADIGATQPVASKEHEASEKSGRPVPRSEDSSRATLGRRRHSLLGRLHAIPSRKVLVPTGVLVTVAILIYAASLWTYPRPSQPSNEPVQTSDPSVLTKIQQAVDAAHEVEKEARANIAPALLAQARAEQAAQRAEQAAKKAKAGAPGYGLLSSKAIGGSIWRWAGQVAHGRPRGVGIGTWDGEPAVRYAGGYLDGVESDFGIHTWTGGSREEGEFHYTVLDGFGVIFDSSGRSEGKFLGINGGVFFQSCAQNAQCREIVGQCSSIYCSQHQLTGYGVVYDKDGTVMIGKWDHVRLNGYGEKLDVRGNVVERGLYEYGTLKISFKQ